MKPRRFAAARGKADATQQAIKAALEAVGASVLILSGVGHGCPDLLVARRRAGGETAYYLLEVKTAKGKLRDSQKAFAARWPDHVWVIRTPEAAVDLVLSREDTTELSGPTDGNGIRP